MLIFRHIGLIILGVFGVFHLTICGVELWWVELLSSTELHLPSQRRSWLVIHSTPGIAQLVGGGGGGGGTEYLHSTQPWGWQSQLSGNLLWLSSVVFPHVRQHSVLVCHLQSAHCSSLSSPRHAAALLTLAARPRLSTVRPEYYGARPGTANTWSCRELWSSGCLWWAALSTFSCSSLQSAACSKYFLSSLPSCSTNTYLNNHKN